MLQRILSFLLALCVVVGTFTVTAATSASGTQNAASHGKQHTAKHGKQHTAKHGKKNDKKNDNKKKNGKKKGKKKGDKKRTPQGKPTKPSTPTTPATPSVSTSFAGTVFGANFGARPDKSFYGGRADAARVYYQSQIPADLTRTAAFAEAYQQGVRTFVISWKDSDDARVATALASLPKDVKVYGTYFHEPEDDIESGALTLAAWTARTNAQAQVMRRYGVIPTSILMAFTVVGGKGRQVSDYYAADVDVFGFDYYPDKLGQTPTAVIGKMADAARASGSGRMLLGEFGILTNAANGAGLVRETKTALSNARAELACYWSEDLHVLSSTVADSWFV